jgi:sugar phosphate isomerase/epimerase
VVTNQPLLATCWTTAGDAVPLPGRHTSPIPLRDRIEAASRAGFAAFGILDFDLRVFLRDATLADLAALLHQNGMHYVELEFLGRWWTSGAEREKSDQDRDFLFTAAQALGAHHIKVAPDLDDVRPPDIDLWAEEFNQLSREAESVGTRVALEFMPFANLATLDLAVQVVQASGHAAGGLLVDLWHVERSGMDPSDVEHLPVELLVAVELDDGLRTPEGDPYDDTVLRRLIPGTGEFRGVEFAAALMRIGWTGPWGVEIIGEDYRMRPIGEALYEVEMRTHDLLSRAQQLNASHVSP